MVSKRNYIKWRIDILWIEWVSEKSYEGKSAKRTEWHMYWRKGETYDVDPTSELGMGWDETHEETCFECRWNIKNMITTTHTHSPHTSPPSPNNFVQFICPFPYVVVVYFPERKLDGWQLYRWSREWVSFWGKKPTKREGAMATRREGNCVQQFLTPVIGMPRCDVMWWWWKTEPCIAQCYDVVYNPHE